MRFSDWSSDVCSADLTMRALAPRGYCCWLPDLPGTGESERALDEVGWDDWRDAARDAATAVALTAGRSPAIASLSGGALLDEAVESGSAERRVGEEGVSPGRRRCGPYQ